MTEIESKTTENTSCALHYLEGDGGAGRAVLLLHGMKFQARTWQELGTLDALSAAGHHAVALDMPGFGLSPACDANQVFVVYECIKALKLNKPILIGPSMGGRIALEFALHHPGILGGLVLVGAVGVEENKQKLPELALPVFLVWGSEDQIAPLAGSEILFNSIQGARRLVLEGAPHPCYLDQPEKWHAALLEFLADL